MMPASEGPRSALPGSIEWQAWHFLNTSRPAAASPLAGGAAAAPLADGVCAGGGSAAAMVCVVACWSLEDGCAGACDVLGDAAGAVGGGFEAAVEVAAGAAAAIWCWCAWGGAAAVSGAGDGLAVAAGAVDDD